MPVYKYGCINRPPAYAHVPAGYVATAKNPEFNHGEVHYDRALTPEELYAYELVDLNRTLPKPGDIYRAPDGTLLVVRSATFRGVRLSDLEYFQEDPEWCGDWGTNWEDFDKLVKVEQS